MTSAEYLGNMELLKLRKTGFIASRRMATTDVIPTLDWAMEMSRQKDIAVVSGFQSPMEKDVLKFLLQGQCPIIIVLARGIYKRLPQNLCQAMTQNRLLVVSIEKPNVTRVSEITAHRRNEYIKDIVDEIKLIVGRQN